MAGLDRYVPIRFRSEVVEEVRHYSRREGTSVSTWIRRAVDRALRDRHSTNRNTVNSAVWTFRVEE